eukprot:14533811-Alexandrium_andersonii.AAC.1
MQLRQARQLSSLGFYQIKLSGQPPWWRRRLWHADATAVTDARYVIRAPTMHKTGDVRKEFVFYAFSTKASDRGGTLALAA